MSSQVFAGDTSGSVTIQCPAVAGSGIITLPVGTGTMVVNNASSAIVAATAQNSTSGTALVFTGIPSWAKRITVLLSGVSTSGSSDVIIQLGTSSGFVSTGYLGASGRINNSNATGVTNFSSGFLLSLGGGASAAATRHGRVVISNLSSNLWVSDFVFGISDTVFVGYGGGSLSLASVLTQVQITTVNGTDTFDAGSINILYE